MRVLLISQYFWPESFQINQIATALGAHGVEVEVLTGKPNYPAGKIFPGYTAGGWQRETYHDVPVHRMPLLPRASGGKRLALNYLSFIVTGLLLAPWKLRGKKFDVIFVYAPSPILQAIPAIFLGWLKGARTILWVQDLWPESLSATGHVRNPRVLKAVEKVVRYIYRKMDLLLVQSEAFIAPVQALASGTPVAYHPNSVDDSFAAPSAAPVPALAGLDAPFSVLFAGNIGSAQAVQVIVAAARLLTDQPDISFVVVGDGSRYAWMQAQVVEHGLHNLHLPGRFPVENMPGFMRKASALLVTLADQEIFRFTVPSKVQAYLAAGRPIIACLNGEGARLVESARAGLTVPAEDGAALADAVLRLYRLDADERAAMGRRGAEYHIAHFSHAMLVNQLVAILRSSTDGANNAEPAVAPH
jgi:glycosyltransferase involved in cell wall biosynthesis